MMSVSHDFKFPKLYRMKLPHSEAEKHEVLGKAPDGFRYGIIGVDPETNEIVYYIEKEDRR